MRVPTSLDAAVAAASRPALSERRHDPLSSSREAESASREKPLEEKPLKEKPPEEKPSPASKERAEQGRRRSVPAVDKPFSAPSPSPETAPDSDSERRPQPASTWPRPHVLYAIQTSAKPVYEAKLRAQFDTWAGPLREEARFAVGPGKKKLSELWEPTGCPQNERLCKAAFILTRAYNLTKATPPVDFDWLIFVFEDFYFDVEQFQQGIAQYDPTKPVVLSSFGCGRSWKYNPQSKNGTVPPPPRWVEPSPPSCEHVIRNGGMCGGFGMYFSRTSVERLFEDGAAPFLKRVKKLHPNMQVDTAISCLLGEKSIKVEVPSKMRFLTINNFSEVPAYRSLRNTVVFHLVGEEKVPDFMRRLHKDRMKEKKAERR